MSRAEKKIYYERHRSSFGVEQTRSSIFWVMKTNNKAKKIPSSGGVHTGKAIKEYKKVRNNNLIRPLYLIILILSQVQGFRKYIRYKQFYL